MKIEKIDLALCEKSLAEQISERSKGLVGGLCGDIAQLRILSGHESFFQPDFALVPGDHRRPTWVLAVGIGPEPCSRRR